MPCHITTYSRCNCCSRTPLHCAIAYSNVEIVRYLVEHGASMFLATRDGDTPYNIAQEEHKLLLEEGEESQNSNTLLSAAKCLEYLRGERSTLQRRWMVH